MLASLRRGFRKRHRKGHATALVISGNKDGSLKVTQSRVLTASGFVYTLIRIPLSVTMGFTGILSTLGGAKGAVHEVRERESHVGSDEQAVHALLARVGPDAALVCWCVAMTRDAAGGRCTSGRPCKRKLGWLAFKVPHGCSSIPAANTTGCAPRSTNMPARTAQQRNRSAITAERRGGARRCP